MDLLSTEDFTAVAGTCRACDGQVAHYVCNSSLIAVRPEAAEWDWWLACTNKTCVHHQGEGVFQVSPAWLVPAPRDVSQPQ